MLSFHKHSITSAYRLSSLGRHIRPFQRFGNVRSVLTLSMVSSQVGKAEQNKKGFGKDSSKTTPPMPITVLSGFLGTGKTTFLNHVLHNQQGLKIGLVVNDMASINVDAKQIRSQTIQSQDGIDTMELQNGCICCSLAEDLIASISKLVTLSEVKGSRYDHIIVECSGIAEPKRIRDFFQQAVDYNLDIMNKIQLDTMITLVDASSFYELFGTEADLLSNRDLAYGKDQQQTLETDGNGVRKVTDLLLEQVECADIVMINKCDLVKSVDEVNLVKDVVSKINPVAKVVTCIRGQVDNALEFMGSAKGKGAADWGVLDEHRKLIAAAEQDMKSHDHNHHHDEHCHDEKCTHPDHQHDHKHDDEHCHDTTCTNPNHHHDHKHEHEHDHDHAVACNDAKCTDSSHNHDHSHSHGHDHKEGEVCHDTTCNDPTHNHDHSHSHSHDNDMTTAQKRFGITSFVYRRRVPFHPLRFSAFLHGLGKLSISGISNLTSLEATPVSKDDSNALLDQAKGSLCRSKGFVWMATSKSAAYFMSHAGQYLELSVLGRWWADIEPAQWPKGIEDEITRDFDGKFGDRRQELVFIGQFGKEQSKAREVLEAALDQCLLTDQEMKEYERLSAKGDDYGLQEYFVNQRK